MSIREINVDGINEYEIRRWRENVDEGEEIWMKIR